MRILLAFDKFKGSLTASDACDIAEDAIREIDATISIHHRPLTDGGEGFCEIVTQALHGVFRHYTVTYPDLRAGEAQIGYIFLDKIPDVVRDLLRLPKHGLLAVLEMAQASGHQLVANEGRNPWNYSTCGVGEMIRYAYAEGATSLLLGMGGSATNDMGVGLLEAFGLNATDKNGEEVTPIIPSCWNKIEAFSKPPQIPPVSIRIACDVRNPLHGDEGAAAVFGPQKGLQPEDMSTMQNEMERIDHLLRSVFDAQELNPATPGMGAAGGLPFGLSIAFDTRLIPGFNLICEILQLQQQIDESDIILTGEGALDKSSLSGKGPYEIIVQGIQKRKQVCVFAGKVFDEAKQALSEMDPSIQINQVGDPEASIEENIRNERQNLKIRIKEALLSFI